MKKNFVLQMLTLLVLVSMLLTACGDEAYDEAMDETMDETMDEAPAAEAADEAPAANGDVVAAFQFTNSGDVDYCELYVSPTGMEDWGDDKLQGKTIPAGGGITMTDIPAGTYDILVIGCDGETENVIPDVSITN